MNRRSLLLGGGLLATLILTIWTLTTDNSGEVVQATARPAGSAPSPRTAPAPGRAAPDLAAADNAGGVSDTGLPDRPAAPQKVRNVFGAYNYQAPPRPVVVEAPPPPHAPPLPFVFSGRLMIPGKATVYLLTQGSTPIEMHLGSDAAGFKLVSESPEQLVFVHEATGDQVAMSIASAAIN